MQGNLPEQAYVSRTSSIRSDQDSRLGRCSLSKFRIGRVGDSTKLVVAFKSECRASRKYPANCRFVSH
jgi:hypothetical protein